MLGPHLGQMFHPAQAKFVVCDYTIENRLHHRRDVTLGEDHCQVRKGVTPRVLAVLNSFLLGLLDFCGVTDVPKCMRIFDARPSQAGGLAPGISADFFRALGFFHRAARKLSLGQNRPEK